MYKSLLISLLACLCSASFARAQSLGNPVTADNSIDLGYGSYAPVLYRHANFADESQAKPARPILHNIAQRMMTPIRNAAGHLMPAPRGEELPTREAVARMIADGGFSPAEITAAKIKIDESQARSRRAAVRYLGTIDCHYYPEAEGGLIAALRADRAESVRFEAALALGNSRGFTEKMLEALNMTALALELDGNPSESSERVRMAARQSLERCVERGLALPPLAHQLAPTIGYWLPPDPLAIQPVGYYLPAQTPAISPRERELAETISAQRRTTTTAPAPTHRSLREFFFGRDQTPASQNAVDPRMRGLAPLGAETSLGIPASYRPAPTSMPMPYNYYE
ncbi:MAG: HEAT repeat domain-containing protein [Planctomycetes bacterium]|nr:HEAT repeat domain-containing protein [Planctomycetota bacterium]